MRLKYLLHSLAYFVTKHKASSKKLEQSRKRHLLLSEEHLQLSEDIKICKLDEQLESKSITESENPDLSTRLSSPAKDDINTFNISTSLSGVSNIKKMTSEEYEYEQLIQAGLLVYNQNSLMQTITEILTRLLYFRIPINKLFTAYYKMLLSNKGCKIIDQENENIKLKEDFESLIRFGCDYSAACDKEMETKGNQDEETASSSFEENKESSTSYIAECSEKEIERKGNQDEEAASTSFAKSKESSSSIIEISSEKEDCNALQEIFNDFEVEFNDIYSKELQTTYNKNAFIQLSTTIGHFNTIFNKTLSRFVKNYLKQPPNFLTNVHPYITTMKIRPENQFIYWMMDWILYTVLHDNLLDLKITIENLAPNGILVKGLIYSFTIMLGKHKGVMLKNVDFMKNWADNLSITLIKHLENGCLYSAINDLTYTLNAIEREGIKETTYENTLSVEDNKRGKDNCKQVQLAVIRIALYFFDITKSFFYDKSNLE